MQKHLYFYKIENLHNKYIISCRLIARKTTARMICQPRFQITAVKVEIFQVLFYFLFIYLFISFLLTINLKLITVHVEIKIVNKEAAAKRSTLLHAQR